MRIRTLKNPHRMLSFTSDEVTLRVPYIPWISAFCTTILSSYHYGASLSDRVVQARRRAQTIELERFYRRRSQGRQGRYATPSLYGVSPVRDAESIE
jgi:hypothetical protein